MDRSEAQRSEDRKPLLARLSLLGYAPINSTANVSGANLCRRYAPHSHHLSHILNAIGFLVDKPSMGLPDSPLTADEQGALLRFLGFGNPKAPLVFIGMEEGLTETLDQPLIKQLRARAKLEPIVGLHQCGVHPEKFLRDHPPIQPTWKMLIQLALQQRTKRAGLSSLDSVRAYQSSRLGIPDGDTLLLEFLPLPARSVKEWSPYDKIFPEFPTRETYRTKMTPIRTNALHKVLAHGPRLVVAYGISYWSAYKQIFPELLSWESDGVFAHATYGETAVLLMPHPVSRIMNGQGAALLELARRIAA